MAKHKPETNIQVIPNIDANGVTTISMLFFGYDLRGDFYSMRMDKIELVLADAVADGIKRIVREVQGE